MLILDQVLDSLRKVRTLRFDATTEAATGWQGTGTGTVTVTEPAAGVVVFTETGTWKRSAPGHPATGFSNVYRWSSVGELLRLEHLRFGPTAPVLLFDMAPGGDGEWREVSPHHCREDCYRAALKVENGQIALTWHITGPQKRESIHYTYC